MVPWTLSSEPARRRRQESLTAQVGAICVIREAHPCDSVGQTSSEPPGVPLREFSGLMTGIYSQHYLRPYLKSGKNLTDILSVVQASILPPAGSKMTGVTASDASPALRTTGTQTCLRKGQREGRAELGAGRPFPHIAEGRGRLWGGCYRDRTFSSLL